jgi:DNA-directed RNA polymerase subunit RPC12/RpoP
MKCIRCNTDNKLKDRTENQGRCSKCNHRFAFEPTTMGTVKITDMMFAKTLSDISINGSLSFTRSQFFSFLEKRLQPKQSTEIGCLVFLIILALVWGTVTAFNIDIPTASPFFIAVLGLSAWAAWIKSELWSRKNRRYLSFFLLAWGSYLVVVGSTIGLVNQSVWVVVSSLGVGGFILCMGFDVLRKPQRIHQHLISIESVNSWLDNWQQINGTIPNLLQSPQDIQSNPSQLLGDVTNYSFDRLVVCDRDSIAHFLIANNFHFENNCAILSIDRYPTDIFESVMTMVRRNPDLKVFVIHDCSAKGLLTAHRIKTEAAWFANTSVTIVNIGLLPRQIMAAAKGFVVTQQSSQAQRSAQLPPAIRQNLSRAELEWLDAGNTVNLESIAPLKLIAALKRSIANSQIVASDDFAGDSGLMVMDGSSDYFSDDSFG